MSFSEQLRKNSTNRTDSIFGIHGRGPCATTTPPNEIRSGTKATTTRRRNSIPSSDNCSRGNSNRWRGSSTPSHCRARRRKRSACSRHPESRAFPVHDPRTESGNAPSAGGTTRGNSTSRGSMSCRKASPDVSSPTNSSMRCRFIGLCAVTVCCGKSM